MEPIKKRVLIADDEVAIRRLLRRILTTEGFECRPSAIMGHK